MADKEGYKQVFKATGLFGGVQVIIIIIGLVRSKVIALLLGTSGFGINGLYQSPLNLINSVTSLGIGFSAVRDIVTANQKKDEVQLSKTIITVKRWAWLTGILGALVVIVCSPLLSLWSFENYDYTLIFICLSVISLVTAISGGQAAILRGLRRLKDTAKVSVIGPFLGLILSIPIYYFYGLKGIAPTLVLTAVVTLVVSWFYSRKIKTTKINLSYKESFRQGGDMVKMGLMITLSGI